MVMIQLMMAGLRGASSLVVTHTLQKLMLQNQGMATMMAGLHGANSLLGANTLQELMLQNQSMATKSSYPVHQISSNLQLIAADGRLEKDKVKPLVVLLPWLMAGPKHTLKYAEFYIGQGFDVLTAFTTTKDVLWPQTGVKVVARQLVDFFHGHPAYKPILLHGFSAGGFLWGETCLVMNENLELYQHVIDRFVGQVWDSVVEFTQSAEGFPRALFPKSQVMQVLARNFMKSYMTVFHYPVTRHYIRASEMFHTNLIRAPALFLLSRNDPVATVESVQVARDNWEAMGVVTYWKVWDRSPHVKHYMHHPMEYEGELKTFLGRIGLLQHAGEVKSKL